MIVSPFLFGDMKDLSKNDYFGPHILFGWSSRVDGAMNQVGHEEYDNERRANRLEFLSHQFGRVPFVAPRLQHGAVCEAVEVAAPTEGIVVADALVTGTRGLVLTVGMGDCSPVFFYDPKKEVIAIAHCGWKGILAGVIESTIEKMRSSFNCYRDDIRVLIGTGICMDCYEVGPEVARKFMIPAIGKVHLSLTREIEQNLLESGIWNTHISAAVDCTSHTTGPSGEPKYFSHRRDKVEPVNTQLAAIMMK